MDENGFPKGEKKHGASIWASTKRKEISHYLIKKREAGALNISLTNFQYFMLYTLSKMNRVLLRLLRCIDKRIFSIEVQQVLRDVYEKKKI